MDFNLLDEEEDEDQTPYDSIARRGPASVDGYPKSSEDGGLPVGDKIGGPPDPYELMKAQLDNAMPSKMSGLNGGKNRVQPGKSPLSSVVKSAIAKKYSMSPGLKSSLDALQRDKGGEISPNGGLTPGADDEGQGYQMSPGLGASLDKIRGDGTEGDESDYSGLSPALQDSIDRIKRDEEGGEERAPAASELPDSAAPPYAPSFYGNLGEALAQATQGPQTPQINHSLYGHMNQQNIANQGAALNRDALRQKVSQSILDRTLKKTMADDRNSTLLKQSENYANKSRQPEPPLSPEALAQKIQIKEAGKAGDKPNLPKSTIKNYNNVNRSLEGIQAAQHLYDMVHELDTGKFGSQTGVLGKAKSYFGYGNADVEKERAQLKAMALPIAVTMSGGNAPTDNMIKEVHQLLPDIDKDESPKAKAKMDAIMRKIFVDAEGPVKSLEMSKDPTAKQQRERLESLRKDFETKAQAQGSKEETKLIKGVVHRKVPGGWVPK